jgi:capsid protein
MMLTVPAGWKMAQLDSKQPTATHGEFVKIILSEIARCVVSTYGTIAGDFSGHNYASGRLDNQLYHKSILVDRSFWESEVLNPIFSRWFREYALVHGIEQHGRYDRLRWSWLRQQWRHKRRRLAGPGFALTQPTKSAQWKLTLSASSPTAYCVSPGWYFRTR